MEYVVEKVRDGVERMRQKIMGGDVKVQLLGIGCPLPEKLQPTVDIKIPCLQWPTDEDVGIQKEGRFVSRGRQREYFAELLCMPALDLACSIPGAGTPLLSRLSAPELDPSRQHIGRPDDLEVALGLKSLEKAAEILGVDQGDMGNSGRKSADRLPQDGKLRQVTSIAWGQYTKRRRCADWHGNHSTFPGRPSADHRRKSCVVMQSSLPFAQLFLKYGVMISTTHELRGSGQGARSFSILRTVHSRPHWLPLPLLLATLLAACGGGDSPNGGSPGPTANDLADAQEADVTALLDLTTNWVTLTWRDTVPGASRYEIEQLNADGSWSALDGVWATQASQVYLHWTGPVESTVVLRVVAMMSGYTVTLSNDGTVAGTQSTAERQQITVAVPSPTPSIAIDQAEPLQGTVNVSIDNGATDNSVAYSLDTPQSGSVSAGLAPFSESFGLSGATTGAHTLYAELEVNYSFSLLLSRTVQVHTSEAAVTATVDINPTDIDLFAVATSDAGIVSVAASYGSLALGTLTQPNACLPSPCSAGQSFNSYHFSVSPQNTTSDTEVIDAVASDSAGHTATWFSDVTFPTTSATLTSPTNNTSVAGTLPVSGTFSSGAPGALEVMVTLSGIPVYDTTVANPGTVVPFATNVSLAGVANGIHTVDVYARVGSANYELFASAFVMVTGASP